MSMSIEEYGEYLKGLMEHKPTGSQKIIRRKPKRKTLIRKIFTKTLKQ